MDLPPEYREELARRRATDPHRTFRPLPASDGQRGFIRHLNQSQGGTTVLLGGNRSGKSECGAFATADAILSRIPRDIRPGPKTVWVVGETTEMVGQIIWKQKLARFIPPRNIARIVYHSEAKQWPSFVRTTAGVEIVFKSAEQGRERFQGDAIRWWWGDEQIPQDIMEESAVRCADFQAPMVYTLTPLNPDPWLQDRYHNPPGGWAFFETSIDDNRQSRGGILADQEVDRLIASWPVETREARRRGAFVGFEGQIFKTWSRQLHLDDFEMDHGRDLVRSRRWGEFKIVTRVRAIDFGFANPFCCLWIALDSEGRYWVYDEHYLKHEKIENHAATIIGKTGSQHIARTWADPGGDYMPTGEKQMLISGRLGLAQAGIDCVDAHKDLWRSIEEVQRLLADRTVGDVNLGPLLIVHERNCPNLAREMPLYMYEPAPERGGDPVDRPRRRDDHAISALRYAVWNERPYDAGDSGVVGSPGAGSLVVGGDAFRGGWMTGLQGPRFR